MERAKALLRQLENNEPTQTTRDTHVVMVNPSLGDLALMKTHEETTAFIGRNGSPQFLTTTDYSVVPDIYGQYSRTTPIQCYTPSIYGTLGMINPVYTYNSFLNLP